MVHSSADAFPSEVSALVALADSLPQIVFIDNAAGVPEYWNRPWYEYTGLTPEESVGAARYSVVHPEERAALATQWPRCVAAGEPFSLELRMRRASDGTYRWHLSRAIPQRDEHGRIVRWYGTLTDIEDQKRVEETLRFLSDAGDRFAGANNVEDTLHSLAGAAVEGIADWCAIYGPGESGEISVLAIAHKDPAKLRLAHELLAAFPPKLTDAPGIVMSTGEPILIPETTDDLLRARAVNERQYELIKALGLRSAMVLPIKGTDGVMGALALIASESARTYGDADLALAQALAQRAALAWQNAEHLRAALESEQRFRTLAETIPAMVWVTGANGALRYANQRWLTYFNFTHGTLAEWRMRDSVHPDDFQHANDRWKESLQTGKPYEVEYRARDASGEYQWFLVRGHPVRDANGKVAQWFGTSTSIDEQKRAYERQRLVADTLQEAFIPKSLPIIEGVEFDATYFAAQIDARIGGDWYDATVLDKNTIVFSIGDVCGHGLEAAVAMGRARQAIIAAALDSRDPASVLAKVNRLLLLQDAPMVTALVGFIDMQAATLTISIAGHPPPLRVTGTTSQAFMPGGIPLAAMPDATYSNQTVAIDCETFIGLYTDGLIEARRTVEADETLTARTIEAAARERFSAAEIRHRVLGDTVSSDDVAILTIRITPRA